MTERGWSKSFDWVSGLLQGMAVSEFEWSSLTTHNLNSKRQEWCRISKSGNGAGCQRGWNEAGCQGHRIWKWGQVGCQGCRIWRAEMVRDIEPEEWDVNESGHQGGMSMRQRDINDAVMCKWGGCHRIALCNYIILPYTFISYASTMPRCSSVSTVERSMQDNEGPVPHCKLPLLIKDQWSFRCLIELYNIHQTL